MTIFKFLKLIKYIGIEKVYSFGRIDLYGVNKDNNNICIELKKKNVNFMIQNNNY